MSKPQDPEAAETVQTTKVPAVDLPRLVRPLCDNCGSPATYRGLHWEAGAVYVCEACRRSHGVEHKFMRPIWKETDHSERNLEMVGPNAKVEQPAPTKTDEI